VLERDLKLSRRGELWCARFEAMASPCEVLVDSPDRKLAGELARIGAREAWRIESTFSRYRDDNIVFRINNAGGAGIEVDLPFIYAAYHENSQRFVYYLGELLSIKDAIETSRLHFYDFDHITWEEINDTATITMLERFIREKRLGNYSVYIGDQQSGEIHPG